MLPPLPFIGLCAEKSRRRPPRRSLVERRLWRRPLLVIEDAPPDRVEPESEGYSAETPGRPYRRAVVSAAGRVLSLECGHQVERKATAAAAARSADCHLCREGR